MQNPRDKPLISVKYIKHHNFKCSLKSIKVNRDLNAVVTLDVTVELSKAFHSDLNAVVTLDVTVELGKAFHNGNNLSVKKFLRTDVLQKGTNKRHVLPRKCARLVCNPSSI